MIEFESLHLRNIVTYKKADLILNTDRISVVRGKNLDRKNVNASNSSGKSILFSTIPNILNNSIRSSVKKNDSKSIIGNKGSSAIIKVKNNDSYEIKQYFEGTTRWSVKKNNKKLKFRKIKDSRLRVQKIVPLTESQIYSQVVVDGRSKSTLQSSNSKQRFEYFNSIFNLNIYDNILTKIVKEHNKIKSLLQELSIIETELLNKKESIPDDGKSYKELVSKHQEVEKKLPLIKEKIYVLTEKLNKCNIYLSIAEGLKSNLSKENLYNEMQEIEKEITDIDLLYKKSIKYHEKLKTYNEVEAKRKEINLKLNDLKIYNIKDLNEIENKKTKISERIIKLNSYIDDERIKSKKRLSIKNNMESIEERYPKIINKYSYSNIDAINRTIANNKSESKELKNNISELETFISSHEHSQESLCPICLRGLSKTTATSLIKKSKDNLNQCYKNIKVLTKILDYLLLKKELNDLKATIKLPDAEEKLKKYKSKFNDYIQIIDNIILKKELLSNLNSLPSISFDTSEEFKKPKPIVYEKLKNGIYKRLENVKSDIDKLNRMTKLGLDKEFNNTVQATKIKKHISQQLDKFRPMLDKAQYIINNLNSRILIRKMIFSDIKRLREKLELLREKTKDYKVYESLRKAFSSKGLRQIRTIYFAKKLQDNLNKYSQFIYGEPIKFKINISNSNFDILAERNNKISDVRSLAGAESSAFTLLVLLSILPFVKSSDRCNILVLDEIESGLDTYSKELFITKFLPLLSQVVPHIFILTPMSDKEFYIPNAAQYLVIKNKNVSTLNKI